MLNPQRWGGILQFKYPTQLISLLTMSARALSILFLEKVHLCFTVLFSWLSEAFISLYWRLWQLNVHNHLVSYSSSLECVQHQDNSLFSKVAYCLLQTLLWSHSQLYSSSPLAAEVSQKSKIAVLGSIQYKIDAWSSGLTSFVGDSSLNNLTDRGSVTFLTPKVLEMSLWSVYS